MQKRPSLLKLARFGVQLALEIILPHDDVRLLTATHLTLC